MQYIVSFCRPTLQGDSSGDYKEVLLALTGDRPPPAPVAEEADAGEPELEEVEEEHIVVNTLT